MVIANRKNFDTLSIMDKYKIPSKSLSSSNVHTLTYFYDIYTSFLEKYVVDGRVNYIEMEKVSISDWEGALAMVRNSNQNVA